jgi:hypothetical protein
MAPFKKAFLILFSALPPKSFFFFLLVPYSVHLLAGMGFHLFSANCGSE